MGVMKNFVQILIGKPEGRNPLGSLGSDGRIKLKWILKKLVWKCGLNSSDEKLKSFHGNEY
jgi:hypothetical protein